MPTSHFTFSHWRTHANEFPEQTAEEFVIRMETLPPATRRAFIASQPDKQSLIQSLKASCQLTEEPLSGIPYMLQDLFDVEGYPTGCGAPFTSPFESRLEDSSLLYQKLNALGAAYFGKTMPAEFGVDLGGSNPTNGDCPHPNGSHLIVGGGAGSAARAVADGLVPLAFGLDTNGGVRVPAALQGLFGFRMPTNAYAREGVFPIAPSVESVGWLNHTLSDLRDTFQAFYNIPEAELKADAEPALHGYFLDFIDSPVAENIRAGLKDLGRALMIDEDPEFSRQLRTQLSDCARAFEILEERELFSIHQYWIEEYRERYDPRLLQKIERGMECPRINAEFSTSVQEETRMALTRFFGAYDYLILPICPQASPRTIEWDEHLESAIRQWIAPASITFLPALILPLHFEGSQHSAVQILLNPRKMDTALRIIDQLKPYYGNQ